MYLGLTCTDKGRCMPVRRDGDACVSNYQCLESSSCVAGKCAAARPGNACSSFQSPGYIGCTSGRYCDFGTQACFAMVAPWSTALPSSSLKQMCASRSIAQSADSSYYCDTVPQTLTIGLSCNASSQCVPGAYCLAGTCTAALAAGQNCTDSKSCGTNYMCSLGTCQRIDTVACSSIYGDCASCGCAVPPPAGASMPGTCVAGSSKLVQSSTDSAEKMPSSSCVNERTAFESCDVLSCQVSATWVVGGSDLLYQTNWLDGEQCAVRLCRKQRDVLLACLANEAGLVGKKAPLMLTASPDGTFPVINP